MRSVPTVSVLALGTRNGQVRLWDLDRDDLVKQLPGPNYRVSAMAYSPDGRLLGVLSEDGSVEIWEVENGRKRPGFLDQLAPGAFVKHLAFSPDGKRLATAHLDGTTKVWRVNDGRLERVLRGHLWFVRAVAFSTDGRLLATAGQDHTARLWNVESGQELAVFRGHVGEVMKVAFSPDGHRLLTGSYDGTLKLWEIRGGDSAAASRRATATASLASRSAEPPDQTFSVGTSGVAAALAFHPDGRRLASVGWDGMLRIHDLRTGQTRPPIAVPGTDARAAGGLVESFLATFRASSPNRLVALGAVAYGPDGKVMAVGTWGTIAEDKDVVYILDAETGRILHQTEVLRGLVNAVELQPRWPSLARGDR